MNKIDFYILTSEDETLRQKFACQLAAKIYQLPLSLTLYTKDEPMAQVVDKLLWTFKDTSFIPHRLITHPLNKAAPITITWPENVDTRAKCCINLTEQLPENIGQYSRLAEIIDAQPHSKSSGRLRFKQYQQQGKEIITHKV